MRKRQCSAKIWTKPSLPKLFFSLVSCSDKSTMYFDAQLYNTMDQPWQTILKFLGETLFSLGFPSSGPEVVMEVGCGPGYLSKHHVLPLFPHLRKMVAMDVTADMIAEAKARHAHPKIEYVVADIEDSSTVQEWEGQITKLTAVHSFNWLKNQRKGFETVHGLLQPGGEAAFFFGLDGPYYDGMIATKNDPKFQQCLQNADCGVPESYNQKYDSSHYRKMLQDIGFNVIHCKDEIKEDILPSDQEFRDIFYSVCPLVKHIPENMKADFKETLFQNILKPNGRSEDGRPIHRCKMVEILVRKEQ